ncbi:hypothetical protein PFISCL1PPCAC_11730, partial [Pristionchus fissidentatus]
MVSLLSWNNRRLDCSHAVLLFILALLSFPRTFHFLDHFRSLHVGNFIDDQRRDGHFVLLLIDTLNLRRYSRRGGSLAKVDVPHSRHHCGDLRGSGGGHYSLLHLSNAVLDDLRGLGPRFGAVREDLVEHDTEIPHIRLFGGQAGKGFRSHPPQIRQVHVLLGTL